MLVELAENNEGGEVVGTERSCAFLVVQVEELILFSDTGVLSNIEEDFSVLTVGSLTEIGNSELSGVSLFLKLSTGHLVGWGTNLLKNPVNDIILSSATSVLSLLAFPIKAIDTY